MAVAFPDVFDLGIVLKENPPRYQVTDTIYTDGYCDYEGEYFDDDDDDVVDEGILARFRRDEKNIKMDIDDESSEDDMPPFSVYFDDESSEDDMPPFSLSRSTKTTVNMKKEKRKLEKCGVDSEQNNGIETAIEVKKKKDSTSKSDV